MKKAILYVTALVLICSCSSGLFKGKEKLGCKSDGRNIGAEKLASGDPKAMKASKKAKYRAPTW